MLLLRRLNTPTSVIPANAGIQRNGWMPDQVRHDGHGVFICQVDIKQTAPKKYSIHEMLPKDYFIRFYGLILKGNGRRPDGFLPVLLIEGYLGDKHFEQIGTGGGSCILKED